MRTFNYLMSGCCVAASAIVLAATPAFAQSQAAVQPAERAAHDDDIIVTARKRNESILRVPVIENAISAATIEKRGVTNFQSLINAVPGVLVGEQTASFGAQVSIRGIGTVVNQPSADQSVALNIDGLPFTQALALKSGFFDVQQVEILKGPQALFFGKGSPAGVISLRTADPGAKFELISRLGYEAVAHEKTGELIVSGPIGDTFGARLALSYSDQDGYFRNTAMPSVYADGYPGGLDPKEKDFAPTKDFVGRLTLKATPSAAFTAKLKLTVTDTKINGDGGGFQFSNCPVGTASVSGIPFLGGENCKLDRNINIADLDPRYFPGVPNGGTPFSKTVQAFGVLDLEYKPAVNLTVTSITGYYNLNFKSLISGDQQSAVPPLDSTDNLYKHDFTQEVRLTSDFKNFPVNFMLAGFYENATLKNPRTVNGDIGLGLPAHFTNVVNTITDDVDSVFGQLIYAVTPQIELAAGGRYSHETHHLYQYGSLDLFTLGTGGTLVSSTTPNVNPRISSNRFSPEATATWRPTSDLTLFGAYKKGGKSGSFNTGTLSTADQSFKDENTQGGEVGLKSRFLDHALSVNLSAYDYLYKNLQVDSIFTSAQGNILRTLNAASARVKGIDFDTAWRVSEVPGLTLSGGANYNLGRFLEFDSAPCYFGQTIANGCSTSGIQNLSGKPLVRAPKWSANAVFDYETPVSSNLLLSFGGTATYTGSNMTSIQYAPASLQKGVTKFDARISLSTADKKWELAFLGKNLTDEITFGSSLTGNAINGLFFGTSNPPNGETGVYAERGRELWVRLSYRM